ncbi:MAG TPA: UDP-N-acetylmuramoyl-tripeptide--D-alanyl-D-alanine ligase [Actinomycetota bacterium]|jgi:UDP-N-acetylmuramoyl-tripeptide--D-alanyl-D-alanine ligase
MRLVSLVPFAFTVWQSVRLRRALHVFQLEGYKRQRFREWATREPRRALLLPPLPGKKPLVMTGRAWRIYVVALVLSAFFASLPLLPGIGSVTGRRDVLAWIVATLFGIWVAIAAPSLLRAADWVLTPVQTSINGRFLRSAAARLKEISPVVVGVTGSFGKTSTKFAVEQLLGPEVALATPGSFNTPLGVCRTINERMEPAHEYFVVEMGAYGVGEIAELCRFVSPTIGVLTAVGPAHLERFGSMDAIRRAKYELIESLPADGLAVMNVDDPIVRELADATTHVQVFRYGLDPDAYPDVTASDFEITPSGTSMTIVFRQRDVSLPVRTRLLGRHAVGHILAAVGVAKFVGLQMHELKGAIEAMEPVAHRLQLIQGEGGVTVIDDAYNSNPSGADAALEVLAAMPGRRKVVVTPGMIELGPLQFEANQRLGERAAAVADTIVVVAPVNRAAITRGAQDAGGSQKLVVVDSLAEATDELQRILGPGDVVLFENDLPDHFER